MQASISVDHQLDRIQHAVEGTVAELRSTLMALAQKVSQFATDYWAHCIYYSALGISAYCFPAAALLGAAWGTFLQCFDSLAAEDPELKTRTKMQEELPREPSIWKERRQYIGGAGMMLTGTYLFGSIAAFIAGWSASDEGLDLLSGRVQNLFLH